MPSYLVTPVISSSGEVRAQVERLLADPLFSQSKRYGAFLRFVTERTLTHKSDPLSERALGVEVFGRAPNYDTDADPIVRVTASEVRKRLGQYYDNSAHAAEIRVVIHKGSYIAEFLPPGWGAPVAEPAVAPVLPAIVPAGDPHHELTAHAAAESSGAQPRRRTWLLFAGIALIVGVLAAVAWFAFPKPSIYEQFWAPIAAGPKNVIVSVPQFADHAQLVGVDDPQLTWTDAVTPDPIPLGPRWRQYSRRLFHYWDVNTATRMSELLGSQGKHVILKGEHDLTMNDLRESPSVILGGLGNQWTSRVIPQARFTFAGEGSIRFIQDKQNPGSRQWQFGVPLPSRDKDLIIISRVADSESGKVTVVAGGFSAWGTLAAVDLLMDPAQMEKVLGQAPHKWNARNLQIALECTVVNLESGIPRLLATHFW